MNFKQFISSWIILLLVFTVTQLRGQVTPGFVQSRTNAVEPTIEWRENWFNGYWYNISFRDNVSFTYNYFGSSAPPPHEDLVTVDAFRAAMGNMSTSSHGLKLKLFGYVEAEQKWCIMSSTLSPEYVEEIFPGNVQEYRVSEPWYSWREIWEDLPPPTYVYEETIVSHNLTIWGRLPRERTVRVYWVADNFGFMNTDWENELMIPSDITIYPPVETDPLTTYNTMAEYFASGSGLWCELGEFNAGSPGPPVGQEPPGWADCYFEGWVKPDLSDGKDWLPEPGSVIGLDFKYIRDDVPATAVIRYDIYRISTWQGECMNYPDKAPQPVVTGTDIFFDFSIVEPLKYEIHIEDVDSRFEDNTISFRRYRLTRELDFPAATNEVHDILWLRANDYGAKAIVKPVTGATIKDLMNYRTTAFGQKVWSVSVPRDDDGQRFDTYNWGDFMADAWEESVLGVQPGNQAVISFVPFYGVDSNGYLGYTDLDVNPAGRNIKGDRFCNWEEYRGFVTVGDQHGFYPLANSKQHRRLNPFEKNVMVHFRSGAEILPDAPGYMDALPDTMCYIVENLKTLQDNDSVRMSAKYWVNFNKYGAYYPYYSARSYWEKGTDQTTTNCPASGVYQNTVVFWPIYRGNHPKLTPVAGAFGYAKGFQSAFNDSCYVPELVYQVEVNVDTIEAFRSDLAYYAGATKDAVWNADKSKLIKNVMAHEFGHCIGMPHDAVYQYIMARTLLLDPFNQNKMILDPPDFTRQYSNQSISKISIKEHPW